MVLVANRARRAYRAAKADGGGTRMSNTGSARQIPGSWLRRRGATESVAQAVRRAVSGQEGSSESGRSRGTTSAGTPDWPRYV